MNRPSLQQQVTFLQTASLSDTSDFYEQVLGMPMVLDQGACRIYQTSPSAFLGFCEHLESADRGGVILTLVSDQVDAWHEWLLGHGLKPEAPPTYNPRFDIYHLFVRDPNGYLVEIQEFRDPAWPRVRR